MAYDRISPIGLERIEIMIAQGHALFANANRNPKKAGEFKVSDFLPGWLRPQRMRQSWQTLEGKLMGITRAMRGSVEEVGDGEWSGEGESSPPSIAHSTEERRHRG